MFRKVLLTTAAVAAMALLGSSTASAADGYYGNSHGNLHQDLGHNEFHRQQTHAYQHQFPQTYYQHNRLHQNLNHDRFHDSLRHGSYHSYQPRYYTNQRYGSGFGLGISRHGFSLRIGH